MGGGARRRHEIAHRRLGRIQQAAHRRTLGRREPDRRPRPRQPVGPVPQGDQPLQRLFGLASLARYRIDIAAVGDQGGGGDLFDGPRDAAPSGLDRIGRQAPAGIEGRAETPHRQAAQQGLEPQRRGHAIDRVHRRQQVGGPHVGVDQGDAVQIGDAAALSPRRHGRVAFDDQLRVRLVAARGGDHLVEALRRRQTMGDGGVPERLIHDQHPPTGLQQAGVQRPAHVRLGHARGDDAVDQPPRPRRQGRVAPVVGARDQVLQPAGPRRIVIDAQIIDDQTEARRPRLADPDRAQEPVLQRHIGPPVLLGPPSPRRRRRLHPPTQHRPHIIPRQAPQVVISQKHVEKRNLQNAGRTHPGDSLGRGVGGRGGVCRQGGSGGGRTRGLGPLVQAG